MESRIEIGNYEITESNFVLMNKSEQKLMLVLNIKGQILGNIFIDFISDKSNEIRGETKVIGDELYLTCYNFDENGVVGTNYPAKIGEIDGKKVCLHLWSSLIGNREVRKVEYTVYKEK